MELKEKANGSPVKTKAGKFNGNIRKGDDIISGLPTYQLDSAEANKYYMGACVDGYFEDLPYFYFGDVKKFIVFKWNMRFNDVGWDKHGNAKKASFFTDEMFEVPAELVPDCIAEIKALK